MAGVTKVLLEYEQDEARALAGLILAATMIVTATELLGQGEITDHEADDRLAGAWRMIEEHAEGVSDFLGKMLPLISTLDPEVAEGEPYVPPHLN